MAVSDTIMPIVNLTWTIPFTEVPPDSYVLTYTATKLSGVPLVETEMMEFFDNETISFATNGRIFTVTDLLFDSHYQFELVAVYGGDSSTAARVNVTMTAEGSELMFTVCTSVYMYVRCICSALIIHCDVGRDTCSFALRFLNREGMHMIKGL